MTPTEQDSNGNGILKQRIYEEIAVIFAGKDLSHEQIASLMDDRKESVELIMRLITADRERVELEARINELENRLRVQFIPSHWARLCAEVNSWAKYVDRRIAELKAQQEEVK